MFPPYPDMTVFHGEHDCTARIARTCTGKTDRKSYRLHLGREGYHDLCERCERAYRRRYLKAMDRFCDAAMNGEIPGPLTGGGVFIIG
jgi:hypothetical protein